MQTYKVTYTSNSGRKQTWVVLAPGPSSARMTVALKLGFAGTPANYEAEEVEGEDYDLLVAPPP
jgi:hypothetical protein